VRSSRDRAPESVRRRGSARSRRLGRTGSARMSISTILSPATVKPMTRNGFPRRAATSPAAALTSAGLANGTTSEKLSAASPGRRGRWRLISFAPPVLCSVCAGVALSLSRDAPGTLLTQRRRGSNDRPAGLCGATDGRVDPRPSRPRACLRTLGLPGAFCVAVGGPSSLGRPVPRLSPAAQRGTGSEGRRDHSPASARSPCFTCQERITPSSV
jgi:hypothetical protein